MKKLLKCVLIILLILVLLIGAGIGYLTITEYRPDDVEEIELEQSTAEAVKRNEAIKLITWNIGYGALGDNADFFMDGGKMTDTADEERVYLNLDGIISIIDDNDPDILLLQEIDRNSKRSHYIDELEYIKEDSVSNAVDNQSAFAYNYYVSFVPVPLPPIGRVECGIAAFSGYEVAAAERI